MIAELEGKPADAVSWEVCEGGQVLVAARFNGSAWLQAAIQAYRKSAARYGMITVLYIT